MTNDFASTARALDVVRPATLFLVATGFGISSTIQAYWIEDAASQTEPSWLFFRLLVLNLIYWYVPALLAPVIMRLSLDWRPDRKGWPTVALFHLGVLFLYSCGHTAVLIGCHMVVIPLERVRAAENWWRYTRHAYLHQLDWLLMTYLFLVGLAYALAYRRESEARALNASQLETRVVEAQLRALRNELRPHFLFNTLNTISGLMRTDIDAADVMIDRLADLLRMTLNTGDTHPLQQELAIVRTYLEIEQTRFGDRLTVQIDAAPDVLDALVPALLLQPLVENAIRHGIAPHARPGWIAVQAACVDTRLTLRVRDSGDGAPPQRLVALNRGIGVANTRARLAHLYSDRHAFEFSNVNGGFCVTVSIPFRTASERRTGAA